MKSIYLQFLHLITQITGNEILRKEMLVNLTLVAMEICIIFCILSFAQINSIEIGY